MLRKVRTSPHSSSKLSFQKGKQSLSASLKFFEHIFIWSEEKPEYTSTEVAEREVLSHKLCLKALSNAAGVLRSSSRMAEQDLVLAELLRVWVHTSSPNALQEACACAEHPCLAWGAGGTHALSQMAFHIQNFTHSSAVFLQLLLLGSPSWDLVCWHPEPDCSIALFHPFASEEVICLKRFKWWAGVKWMKTSVV